MTPGRVYPQGMKKCAPVYASEQTILPYSVYL